MPNRILREGINSSPRVDQLSDAAEILYRRLISVVDDYGRYYASPGTLRGACWPLRPERVDEQLISNCLAECVATGLLIVYGDGRFLQLSDFRQQVRSKSKFPEPDINCVANAEQLLSTSRSRISESKAQSDTPPVSARAAIDGWKSDAEYCRFVADYLATGGAFIDADFLDAFAVWSRFDFQQKLDRVRGLNRHAEEYHADPRFVPKPRKFLESEWERAPRPPANGTPRMGPQAVSKTDRVRELAMENLAKTGRLL